MLSQLTAENAANELLGYVQFFRGRTMQVPYAGKLSERDLIWAENQYGKRWGDGIKIMVEATGLSAEALIQAVDDYEVDVADALDRFNSKYRG